MSLYMYIRCQQCYMHAKGEIIRKELIIENQGPVVQSIVSLTSSLRGQLVKCFMTLQPNTLKFFEKMREA